jgi:hypothetical protein
MHGNQLLAMFARHLAARRIEAGLLHGPVEAFVAIPILLRLDWPRWA